MNIWRLDSARNASGEGRLHEWVEGYLQVPEWANPGLLRHIRAHRPIWIGPFSITIATFDRIAGAGPAYKFGKDEAEWECGVRAILDRGIDLDVMPPVIARVDGPRLHLSDGNHRIDALTQAGIATVQTLIWVDRDPVLRGRWSLADA